MSDTHEMYSSCLECGWTGPTSETGDADTCPNCKRQFYMTGFMNRKQIILKDLDNKEK